MTNTLRRWLPAAALVVAPATGGLAALVDPSGSAQKGTEQLAAAHASPSQFLLAAMLLLVSWVLLVPAVAVAARLVRQGAQRSARVSSLTRWAVGLTYLGTIAITAIVTVQLVLTSAADQADQAAMRALAASADTGVLNLFLPLLLAGAVGGLVLGVAAWLTRAVPRAAAAALVLAPLVGVAGGTVAELVSSALLLAGLGSFVPLALRGAGTAVKPAQPIARVATG